MSTDITSEQVREECINMKPGKRLKRITRRSRKPSEPSNPANRIKIKAQKQNKSYWEVNHNHVMDTIHTELQEKEAYEKRCADRRAKLK